MSKGNWKRSFRPVEKGLKSAVEKGLKSAVEKGLKSVVEKGLKGVLLADSVVKKAARMGAHRAVVVFARLPVAGKCKTRLAAGVGVGAELAAEFYKRCCEHVVASAMAVRQEATCCFVFFSDPAEGAAVRQWINGADLPFPAASNSGDASIPIGGADLSTDEDGGIIFRPQEGVDLGQRMHAAFQAVLAEGAKKILIVGSDVPDLSPQILEAAFDALDSSQVVFGPAKDGGYYLIGARDSHAALFESIPWSSPSTLSASLSAAATAGIDVAPLSSLPLLRDIDEAVDVEEWFNAATRVEGGEEERGVRLGAQETERDGGAESGAKKRGGGGGAWELAERRGHGEDGSLEKGFGLVGLGGAAVAVAGEEAGRHASDWQTREVEGGAQQQAAAGSSTWQRLLAVAKVIVNERQLLREALAETGYVF